MLQERLASGEDVFGPLLRKFLLNNSHRVTVELLPDSKLGAEQEQSEKAKLKTYQESLSPDAIEATIHKTKELKERQVTLYLVPQFPPNPGWTPQLCMRVAYLFQTSDLTLASWIFFWCEQT